ncbi:MAG: GC-type dockerin domain-anchored protein, partial [Planctomycetota bacterium]
EAEFNSTMRFVRGTLLADPSSVLGPDALLTGPFTLEGDWIGRGTVAIDEEGVLRIDGALTGATVRASAGGTVECFGTITGGTIIAGDGGAFVTGLNTTYEHSTIRGEYVVDIDRDLTLGAGSTIEDRLVIRGAPTGDGRVDVADAAAIEGLIVLDAVTSHQASLRAIGSSATLAQGSRIAGQGALWGPWLVHGTLDPGFGGVAGLGDAVGLLQPAVESRLTLSPSARLHIDIAGRAPGSFDRLATTSADASVVLGGILRVRFADGYAPDATDRYEIVRATVVDGAFATIDVEPAGSTASVGPAHVVYTGDAAVLVLCAADRDGDGELTIFDFLEYQNQFDARDPQADLDGDGRLTLFDFLAFQNGFDAGCG